MLPSDEQLGPIAVHAEELADFAWQRIFGNSRPVELEIGCGKGGFLLRRAQALPERNFFAIEWASKYYRIACDRMRRWRVENVRILRADAEQFIKQTCPRESLLALHIYHPDPWPKKRHHKRRLIQPAFADAAVACLVQGGRLALQTDHAGYFEWMCEVLRGRADLREVRFDDPQWGVQAARVATNFEIKYEQEGRAIYQLAFERA